MSDRIRRGRAVDAILLATLERAAAARFGDIGLAAVAQGLG